MAKRKSKKTLLQKRRLSAKHRKAISRGLRRYWRRQKEEGVPRGYTSKKREVEPMLNRAKRIISEDRGVDVSIRREVNADTSIDWEMRIAIPRGVKVDDVLIDLATVLRGVPRTWIGVGVRFQSDRILDKDVERKADYERFRTALQVHAHYQRNTDRKIQTNILGIQKIVESMVKNKHHKPHEIFVRIHWNMKGERPS